MLYVHTVYGPLSVSEYFRRLATDCFFLTWLAFVLTSAKAANTSKIYILFTGKSQPVVMAQVYFFHSMCARFVHSHVEFYVRT